MNEAKIEAICQICAQTIGGGSIMLAVGREALLLSGAKTIESDWKRPKPTPKKAPCSMPILPLRRTLSANAKSKRSSMGLCSRPANNGAKLIAKEMSLGGGQRNGELRK